MYKSYTSIYQRINGEIDREVLSQILRDTPALATASVKPPQLKRLPKNVSFYETVRFNQTTSQKNVTELFSDQEAESLAIGAAACNDYAMLWKVLKHVKDNRWHLLSANSYRLIAEAIVKADSKLRKRTDQLLAILQNHIRLHPQYQEMHSTALIYANAIATDRPIQALNVYANIQKEFKSQKPTYETAILELELASRFPYIDTLKYYLNKAIQITSKIDTVTKKKERQIHSRIVSAFIRGLITANQPQHALEILTTLQNFHIENAFSMHTFLEDYRALMSVFVERDLKSVEKMLVLLKYLPYQMSSMVRYQERLEWYLKAHAHVTEGQIKDVEAFAILEGMSLACGVTSEACNAYLGIVYRNAPSSNRKAAIEAQIDHLQQKFAFLPDGSTFALLQRSCTTLEQLIFVLDRACQAGYATATVYAQFCKRFGQLPASRKLPDGAGVEMISTIASQFQESGLSWTPQVLEGLLQAMISLGMYQSAVDLFLAHVSRGEIAIDATCGYLALDAARGLEDGHSKLSFEISTELERNLERMFPSELRTDVESDALPTIAARSAEPLKHANSRISKAIASKLNHDVTLGAIIGHQPWMTLDPRSYNLVSLHSGFREDLYAKITSAPCNMVPTDRTYLLLIHSTKRNRDLDDMLRLFTDMLQHHPQSVTNAIVDEVLSAIVTSGREQSLTRIQSHLASKNIHIPEPQEIVRRFKQSL